MVEVSRVTLSGRGRRVDVVLPSEEPVGRLLPDLLSLLGEAAGATPRTFRLVTVDGALLSPEQSLREASVPDGATLRLVGEADVPPAPIVHDVIEEATGDLEGRADRWGPPARRRLATAATATLLVTAGLVARADLAGPFVLVVLVGIAVLAAVGGVLVGPGRAEAVALSLASGAAGLLTAWTAAELYGWRPAILAAGFVAVGVLTLVQLGYLAELGFGGWFGTAVVGGLGAGWVTGVLAGVPIAALAAVLAVAAVLALGQLPRLAVSCSGLAGLDDRRSRGAPVSRQQVAGALAATHRGLLIATIAVAGSGAVSGVVLAADLSAWTAALAGLLAVALAARSRSFPLTWQVVSLRAAAVIIVVAL